MRIIIKNLGDYTSRLNALKKGDIVSLEGPYGRFNNKRTGSDQVWIAAGIGVTPFLGMAEDLHHDDTKNKVIMYYSARYANDLMFMDYLKSAEKSNKNFRLITWLSSEKGRLAVDDIKKISGSLAKKEFYLCGPKEFKESMSNALIESGVPKKQDIRRGVQFQMNIKTAVTGALIVFFIAAANILSFGILDSNSFPVIYLVLTLISIGLIITSISSMLTRSDLIFAIILGALISLPLAFFAGAMKTNYETTRTMPLQEQNLMAEMNNISANNEYYASYVSYLNTQISQYEKNTRLLESQISRKIAEIAAKKKAAAKNQTVIQPTPPETIISEVIPEEIPVDNRHYDDDEGEYDD